MRAVRIIRINVLTRYYIMTNFSAPNGNGRLRIAVQKSGRLNKASVELLQKCGVKFIRSKNNLLACGQNLPIDLLYVRDDDIPRLIASGSCQLGIAGGNVFQEERLTEAGDSPSFPTPLRTLDFGQCRLSIAVPEGSKIKDTSDLNGLRIATSYPALTRDYLSTRGVTADIVLLSGSVEVAPELGTADAICDLVSTGQTLAAHRLIELQPIFQSQALLLGGPEIEPSMQPLLNMLLARVDGVLTVNESKYVMLHAPANKISEITGLLPGAETPTVLPLEGNSGRVAVHAVCRESVFWEHLESLKAAGASSVLVLPVEKMLA